MGKKSGSKESESRVPEAPAKGSRSVRYFAIIIAVVGVTSFALMYSRGSGQAVQPAAPAAADSSAAATPPQEAKASPEAEAAAKAAAAIGPHKQAVLPPLPFRGYDPPRPVSVVKAAYEFAAEHPEVLSYVPCFCGCEQGGHRGNEDCFVKARATNGDVVEWEEHGVECAVCIDVATRSRQMHASGASVRDIRTAIEKEFARDAPLTMRTPKPPAHDH